MKPGVEKRDWWKMAVRLVAAVGLSWSLFFSGLNFYSLIIDSSNRQMPMVWFFGILLGPIIGTVCWRLYQLRRWAAFTVCILTVVMLNDFLTGPSREGIWNPFSLSVCIASVVIICGLLSHYSEWKSGL